MINLLSSSNVLLIFIFRVSRCRVFLGSVSAVCGSWIGFFRQNCQVHLPQVPDSPLPLEVLQTAYIRTDTGSLWGRSSFVLGRCKGGCTSGPSSTCLQGRRGARSLLERPWAQAGCDSVDVPGAGEERTPAGLFYLPTPGGAHRGRRSVAWSLW